MLGDISPQTVRITQQAVVYPSRDHVTSLRVERFDGRTYKPVDMTAVTRVILSFPEADPVIVYDSSVQAVFTHVGTTLTVDLSDYAMPASVLGCQIILYDAEHPAGQVLVDDIDAVVQFDFRNVSATGGTPPPAAEYLTDAPIDGVTYARKDGLWVPVDALVSGVSSVNGQSGVVVLDAADVGADVAGAATAAVAAHTAASDPHTQYLTSAEASSAYAPLAHVGSGGAAHANAIAAGAAGFMTGADKTKLDGVAAGATQNSADATLLARANHTGTQTASTISDFASASRAQTEAELVAGTNVTITPSGSGATRQLTIAAAGGGGSTNLSTTTSTTTLTVNSDTGTDAVLPAATPSVAGVLTAADKTKLDGVAAGATANANTDTMAEGSTNKYFTEIRVLATLMAGFTLIAGGAVSAADSLLVAVGKLQKQINDLFSGKQDTLVSGTNIKTVNGSTLLGSGNLVVTGGDMLSTLISSEVSITGATTLTASAFGKMHVCTGTSADYTLVLPAASGNAGKFIGFRMSPSLTKFVTLDANAAELIDGAQSRAMWKNEVAVLLCDGAAWTKIGGKTIPMVAEATRTAVQSISMATVTTIDLTATTSDPAGLVDLTTDRISIKRSGTYLTTFATVFQFSGSGTSRQARLDLNGANLQAAGPDYGQRVCRASFPQVYASGDYLQLSVYQNNDTEDAQASLLSIVEVPDW